jgi:hypothetical protein
MTTIRLYSIILIAMAFFAVSAGAQTRKPVRRPTPKPKATPSAFKTNLEISQGKEQVSNQVANVTRFTALMAPIASSIETLDAEARKRPLSKSAAATNNANKDKLKLAIKNFRTKPTLRRFLPNLQGITQLSTESEDLAYAGKFTESRRPLLAVLQKLSDTLAVMP